jgi:hypothetical protein
LVGIVYFAFAKRRFDFLSVACFSSAIYFLPGLFGFVQYPSIIGFTEVPLVSDAYLVMIFVEAVILVSAIASDMLPRRRPVETRSAGCQYGVQIAIAISIVGVLFAALTSGGAYLSMSKTDMMKEITRWHLLATSSASVGAVLAFERRHWRLFCLAMIVLLVDVFVGFRASFALTLISVFVLFLTREVSARRLALSHPQLGLIALATISFLFAYKGLYMAVRAGSWEIAIENLAKPEFYNAVLFTSEPFVTQAILNEVITSQFEVGVEHLAGVLSLLLLFSPELGVERTSFNALFQSALFPGAEWMGMANNIWAEMLSSGGWPLLLLFTVLYVATLVAGSRLLRSQSHDVRAGAALVFSYWAFYFHRNDVIVQIVMERRVILILIMVVFLSRCIEAVRASCSPKAANVGRVA